MSGLSERQFGRGCHVDTLLAVGDRPIVLSRNGEYADRRPHGM